MGKNENEKQDANLNHPLLRCRAEVAYNVLYM